MPQNAQWRHRDRLQSAFDAMMGRGSEDEADDEEGEPMSVICYRVK